MVDGIGRGDSGLGVAPVILVEPRQDTRRKGPIPTTGAHLGTRCHIERRLSGWDIAETAPESAPSGHPADSGMGVAVPLPDPRVDDEVVAPRIVHVPQIPSVSCVDCVVCVDCVTCGSRGFRSAASRGWVASGASLVASTPSRLRRLRLRARVFVSIVLGLAVQLPRDRTARTTSDVQASRTFGSPPCLYDI